MSLYKFEPRFDDIDHLTQGFAKERQESRQNFQVIDLDAAPPDAKLLAQFHPNILAKIGAIAWRRIGNTTIFAVSHVDQATQVEKHFAHQCDLIAFVFCSQHVIDRHLISERGVELVSLARDYCPPQFSIRRFATKDNRLLQLAFVFAIFAVAVALPRVTYFTLITIASTFIICNSLVRFLAIINYIRNGQKPGLELKTDEPSGGWPRISILIPLYKEADIAARITAAAAALDYPANRLDIKVLLEEDDEATIDEIKKISLPYYFDPIIVPHDSIKTKPKAMNFALPFCSGDIIGVLDAEDKPERLQLKKVANYLENAPAEVACVQGELDFYNTKYNWFTRCFTIEYRVWFHLILPIVARLGWAVPLGGTTLYFRADVLRQIGAWDAYNVTEDADLGFRLVRLGYTCHVIPIKTYEEANCYGISWIRQRSRWLKGYIFTWQNMMTNPINLWRELGPRAFLGVHITLMGAVVNYMALPLFWLIIPNMFGVDLVGFHVLPDWSITLFFSTMLFAQLSSLTLGYFALRESEYRHLFPWWLTLPAYWPLGSFAVYKAIIELFVAPFYWDKTKHGNTE